MGAENLLDNTFFAQREDETRVVLIPGHLKSTMEKSLFEFRQKDIFRFETDDVKNITLRAKETRWEAERIEEEWFFVNPVKALAVESKISGILNSLSGLKAKEFVSEEKDEGELEQFGLDEPDYEIVLTIPVESQKVTFSLHQKEDRLLATTSLSSKVIEVEDTILTELEEEVRELRETEVADFYSWEVNRLHLKLGELDWRLSKDEENNWHFESPVQEKADNSKIQTFIRQIESLEAEEFIDSPSNLKDYGLEKPWGEIKISVKAGEEESEEITVLIGSEDTEAKKIVVKNAKLDYLFRMDSSFLEEFPKEIQDWKPEVDKETEDKKDEKGINCPD